MPEAVDNRGIQVIAGDICRKRPRPPHGDLLESFLAPAWCTCCGMVVGADDLLPENGPELALALG